MTALRNWVADMGSPDGSDLAPATIHRVVQLLNKCVNAAYEDRLIPHNPVAKLPPHAIHMAAVTQGGHVTAGRVYYLRKQNEGKTRKEALRALKRQLSDAVYQRLIDDTRN